MCGILAVLNIKNEDICKLRKQAIKCSRRQSHRGPDRSGCVVTQNAILVHERLSVIDVSGGSQPLRKYGEDDDTYLCVNGEIYNHKALLDEMKVTPKTKSDCEVILHMSASNPSQWLNKLTGMFAFVMVKGSEWIIARDHVGIIPLYYGYGRSGKIWVSSELKAIHDVCVTLFEFPPGHYITNN